MKVGRRFKRIYVAITGLYLVGAAALAASGLWLLGIALLLMGGVMTGASTKMVAVDPSVDAAVPAAARDEVREERDADHQVPRQR